jgi:hypothetical protein
MNNDHDLEHLIDGAARQMARCEPSDALSGAVMARISTRATRFALPRIVWGSFAAAAVIGALAIAVGVNRTAPSAQAPAQAQASGLTAQGAEFSRLRLPAGSQRQARRAREAQSAEAGAQGSGTEKSAIASIAVEETEPMSDSAAFEVIAPAPLEVDRLEVTTLASIDPIEIAPLEIEPLSASND